MAKQKRRIAETVYEKQERIDRKLNLLDIGRMSHAQIRGAFEECLEEQRRGIEGRVKRSAKKGVSSRSRFSAF